MYSYITVLSNWLEGYEKYSKKYSKENISKSTYPDVFYLLKQDELSIGLEKAQKLIEKIDSEYGMLLSNNKIIKINTFPDTEIFKNMRNGKGYFINQNFISVHSLEIYEDHKWKSISIEDANALAYKLSFGLKDYKDLSPRSLSFLPVASACQAKCKFCFSESSISTEQEKKVKDFEELEFWCKKAKEKGAQRFVITGGGEPGIMKFEEIVNILNISNKYFDNNTMISNGLFLSKKEKAEIKSKLNMLKSSGLNVLSLSYHHFDPLINKEIMGIDTKIEQIFDAHAELDSELSPLLRLVCVLQETGIHDKDSLESYLKFAINNKVKQICFKELYVASTHESLYSNTSENSYCKENQIGLDVIHTLITENYKNEKIAELPWGSPIYRIYMNNKSIDVAMYTEPSLGWERKNGIARSWNYMADKKCYASLEDMNSILKMDKE